MINIYQFSIYFGDIPILPTVYRHIDGDVNIYNINMMYFIMVSNT